ncbi:hypothetical protein ACFQYP_14005 [Nonomuraea antimicrobica]
MRTVTNLDHARTPRSPGSAEIAGTGLALEVPADDAATFVVGPTGPRP